MTKRILIWIATVFMGAFLIFTIEAVVTRSSLEDKTLRLHILANSDAREDQEQKLRLRDRILEEVHSITAHCRDMEEAERVLRTMLPQLEETAGAYLAAEGSSYGVSVALCRESFPTRQYDTFSLPAGEYHALRIVIGEGKGKNWWCVVFPTLCNATDPKELERMAEEGGYEDRELAFIQKEEPKYVLQFKVLEWIRAVFN